MKRKIGLLAALFVIFICGCAESEMSVKDEAESNASTWQEQYDLGIRYLSEGNYDEAIIAFTAAIEIDPKRVDAYLGLADAYTGAGDVERAREALSMGLAETGDESVRNALERLSAPMETEEQLLYESGEEETEDGGTEQYEVEYDDLHRVIYNRTVTTETMSDTYEGEVFSIMDEFVCEVWYDYAERGTSVAIRTTGTDTSTPLGGDYEPSIWTASGSWTYTMRNPENHVELNSDYYWDGTIQNVVINEYTPDGEAVATRSGE